MYSPPVYQQICERVLLPTFRKYYTEGLICTPFSLIEEILDNLPVHVWTNPGLKWLDPCCGRGAFLLAIKQRLVAAGIPEKHVVENMLYGADIDPKNTTCTKALLAIPLDPSNKNKYAVKHIEECDSLKKDWQMFDVVVGNPPFQSPGKENATKLWPQFIELSFDLCQQGGIVSLITPKQWLINGMWERYFLPNQIVTLNVDECKNHFPDVHSSFSYFVVQKQAPTRDYTATLGDGVTRIVTTPSRDGSEYMYSGLLGKLINRERFQMITSSGYNTAGFSTGNKTLSKIKTDSHVHFVVHKISAEGKTDGFWASKLDKTTYGVPRVIAGLWLSNWKRERMVVSAEMLTCEQFRHFPTATIAEAEVLKSVLSSNLYRYILYNLVDGNSTKSKAAGSITNYAVSHFPKVDLTRTWDDGQLYSYFELTPEEINCVEAYLTKGE